MVFEGIWKGLKGLFEGGGWEDVEGGESEI